MEYQRIDMDLMDATEFPSTRGGLDSFALVALVLIAFGGWVLFRDIRLTQGQSLEGKSVTIEGQRETLSDAGVEKAEIQPVGEKKVLAVNENLIAAPYDQYVLTQGPHGYSYGHKAIDIVAGKGAIIKSPIDGRVNELYVDQYGNPTLVIENDIYRVTMLHGKYKVEVGQRVKLGQKVGRESNLGYTTDIWGRSCRHRDCGYHTHLNIFDKRLGSNINPLDVIE